MRNLIVSTTGTKMIGEKETEIFQLDHFSDESSSSVVEERCHAS